uniref:Uncharacterized protein n=1 Tax=Anguilla anguilla TaxID=7936 RepID=A0A0E9WTP5_ANGAN
MLLLRKMKFGEAVCYIFLLNGMGNFRFRSYDLWKGGGWWIWIMNMVEVIQAKKRMQRCGMEVGWHSQAPYASHPACSCLSHCAKVHPAISYERSGIRDTDKERLLVSQNKK